MKSELILWNLEVFIPIIYNRGVVSIYFSEDNAIISIELSDYIVFFFSHWILYTYIYIYIYNMCVLIYYVCVCVYIYILCTLICWENISVLQKFEP